MHYIFVTTIIKPFEMFESCIFYILMVHRGNVVFWNSGIVKRYRYNFVVRWYN
jgi:hypothetical protein